MTTDTLDQQIARASEALIALGGDYVDLPMLLPAGLVLELAGEGLRPRLFFATAPDGSELCLRADLTIPAALRYVETAKADNNTAAWAAKGPVFRGPRAGEDRAPEFVQIGMEQFGGADVLATDVAVFLAAWTACRAAGIGPLEVRFCDGGLLPSIIDRADIPEVWRNSLREHTGHTRTFLGILAQASGKNPSRPLSRLEKELVGLSFEAAQVLVEQALVDGDLTLAASRSVEDVTNRLMTRIKCHLAPNLSADIAQTLEALVNFKQTSNIEDSLIAVLKLATRIGVDLSGWHRDWQARLDGIARQAPDALTACRLDALSDEAFDYYDGMAFDIATNGDFTRPVATGGRYDQLIGVISGGKRQARAIGCVIRPDRFAGAMS